MRLIRRFGGRPRAPRFRPIPVEAVEGLEPADRAIIDQVLPYTMTGAARLEGLLAATSYVVRNDVPGAFVECGVWQGGSMLAVALRLLELGETDRDLYLYDTFEGMSEPTEEDVSDYSPAALEAWREADRKDERVYEGFFGKDVFDEATVRERLLATGYPEERVHLVRGDVEATIPDRVPDRLAVLRLDTDWYRSTLHEMRHLYPLLSSGGVLIVDDYGHWKGCRRAVDEYFAALDQIPLLQRVDYTCRQGVKP